jgi:hypothetical protein
LISIVKSYKMKTFKSASESKSLVEVLSLLGDLRQLGLLFKECDPIVQNIITENVGVIMGLALCRHEISKADDLESAIEWINDSKLTDARQSEFSQNLDHISPELKVKLKELEDLRQKLTIELVEYVEQFKMKGPASNDN